MYNRGFSLVEMLVAIAIFLVVSVAALGALLAMTAGGQKVQATRTVVDNISFVLDDIVRESRLAVNHWCGNGLLGTGDFTEWVNDGDTVYLVPPGTCSNGTYFAFNKLEGGEPGEIIWYRINGNIIEKGEGRNPSVWLPLSLSNIEVLDLTFVAETALQNDQIPLITIHLSAIVDEGTDQETEYNVQTSVHPRYPRYKRP